MVVTGSAGGVCIGGEIDPSPDAALEVLPHYSDAFALIVSSQNGETTYGSVSGYDGRLLWNSTATFSLGTFIGATSTDKQIDDSSNGTGSAVLYIGNKTIDTSVVSDARTKNVTGYADIRKAERLYRLPVKRYTYRQDVVSDGGVEHTGFIAQDVHKVWPEAVIERSDGYLQVDRDELIPPMLMLIKSQANEIAALRKRIEALENR